MRANRTKFHRISRDAARVAFLCLAMVVGGSWLMLHFTVWQPTRTAAPEPFYSRIPEVDLSGLPPPRQRQLLQSFQVQRCPCECMRTLASCRNHHISCRISREIARAAVEKAKPH